MYATPGGVLPVIKEHMDKTVKPTQTESDSLPAIDEVLERLSGDDAKVVRRFVAQYQKNHNQLDESWSHLRLA